MTLSHCWGKAFLLKLTAEVYPDLLKGMAVSKLPQTFQDAAKVVLELDAKFLWVDSLCIFQDSLKDWREQSSTMGKGYRKSLCNLGATASKDINGGLKESSISESLRTLCYVQSMWSDATNSLWHV